jgi:hypothetical protein
MMLGIQEGSRRKGDARSVGHKRNKKPLWHGVSTVHLHPANPSITAESTLTALHTPSRAKNFVPGKEGQSSKVSAAVLELQRALPMARAVYCSATGVSEVGHMAYMDRMGLWGAGSAFADFQSFLDSMKHRGVSFLEMLAMELKSEGKYVARGLSFRDAEFVHLPCRLDDAQVCRSLPLVAPACWLHTHAVKPT